MVTINAQQLSTGWAVTVSCLSTDDKPSLFDPPGVFPAALVPMPNGAKLREFDTGKTYRFDADSAAWFPQPAARGGYPEPTGTIDISANGLVNVKDYAEANVQVSRGGVVQPLNVTANDTYNPPSGVDGYAPVTVNVQGGGASISTDFGGLNEFIPVMTSDNTPSGTASASSTLDSSFAAYRAFDGVNTQSTMQGGWLASDSDRTPWIQYVFDSLKKFSLLRIRTANNSTTVTRNVTVEGLTASGVWENCLASGNSVDLEFRQNTFGDSCLSYQIALNGQQYKGLRISGNERFYGGTNQYACTFDSIQIYEVLGQFPGIGYYGTTIPLDSFGGDGNLYTDLLTGITYQKQNGSWSEI